MKHLKHLLAALVFVSLIIFTSCGGDSGGGKKVDPAKEQADKLVASWGISANGARIDGTPAEGWGSFSLTVTGDKNGGSYTTTGSASADVWPASGTWTFDGEDIGTISRNDGVKVAISSVTASGLSLAFPISGVGVGRTSSVNGNWTFTFTKQ